MNASDAALAIGEHAFRAGFRDGAESIDPRAPGEEMAWSLYEPPEDLKGLRIEPHWPPLDSLLDGKARQVGEPRESPVLEVLAQAVQPASLMAVYRNLQLGGYKIPSHGEEETAAALYFMLGHALKHGAEWRTTMIAELRSIQQRGLEVALVAAGFRAEYDS